MKRVVFFALCAILTLSFLATSTERGLADSTPVPIASAAVASVPAAYQPLYSALKRDLDAANTFLDQSKTASTVPITFAADLLTANGNRGESLLAPATLTANTQYLDRLAALGVSGVKISLNYPLLTSDFPNFAEYLKFYQSVAQDVRNHHMTLMIQQSILFANTPFTSLKVDFAGLTYETFQTKFHEMAQTILDKLQPDYLVIMSEPDTESHLSGLAQLADPTSNAAFVASQVKSLNKGKTLLGAGTGSWSPLTFTEKYATIPGLDVIDIHVYPITGQLVENAFAMAQMGRKAGKRVIMSEAWLYKTAKVTEGDNVAASPQIYRIDAFSFWSPLDQQFMTTMAKLAAASGIEFVSFFWSSYLFGYLDYTPALDAATYPQTAAALNKIAFANLSGGLYSPTGAAYQKLIAAYGGK